MKAHIMIALGILMVLVFGLQGAVALLEPGLGVREAYLAGGLVLAAWLIKGGVAEWRHARALRKLDGPEQS